MRSQSLIRVGAVVVALVAALVMSGVLLGAAVQRRAVRAPEFTLSAGSFRIAGFVTQTPNCRTSSYGYEKGSICSGSSILMTTDYFAVWVLQRSKRGTVTVEQARRLLVIRLEGTSRPVPPGPGQ
jgi:hypothetical protein